MIERLVKGIHSLVLRDLLGDVHASFAPGDHQLAIDTSVSVVRDEA